MTDDVMASYWVLVLSDWKRANADVTITLRSGATVGPGKVTDTGGTLGACVLHDNGYRGRPSYSRPPEHKWNVDLNEIVAIEAVSA